MSFMTPEEMKAKRQRNMIFMYVSICAAMVSIIAGITILTYSM